MKTWLIAFACLLLPGLATARCGVEVIDAQGAPVITFQPSSPTVRIIVSLGGKPLAGAKVDIYENTAEEHPEFSTSTGEDGAATFPKLIPGHHYHVVAVGVAEMRGDLYLAITKDSKASVTTFPVNVALPWRVLAAEGMAPSLRLKRLTGVVQDVTGAVIPNAFVEVWKKGATNGPPLEEIRSDAMGHFATQLQNGTYIVLFSFLGFQSSVVVLEISDTADVKNLQVNLEVGACT